MADNKPLVSIGMPVYNGEKYIRQALDSLLAQDYGNFELLISDNASTDRTQEICHEYAMRDNRIRYYRNRQNMGAVWNFNRVFELSKGEYFMWAADHDLWDSTFISHCVSVFESDSGIVLVYPQTMYIGLEGEQLRTFVDWLDTRCVTNPSERFHRTLWARIMSLLVYGLIRGSALRQSRGMRNTPGPDVILIAELSLLGTFAHIPKVLFYLRVTWGTLTGREYRRRQAEALTGNRINRFVWPYLSRYYRVFEYWRLISHARLDIAQKMRLAVDVVCHFVFKLVLHVVVRVYRLLPVTIRMLIRRRGHSY
jgi:glycosyltransferase involved in cell wall biosynthesis